MLALDGELGRPPAGFDVIAQVGGGLGERLGHALAQAGGPALVVGMDTPQVGPLDLARATALLEAPGADAVLGPALDGGYWALGMRAPDPAAFAGVPMSRADTGAAQLRRLKALGLRVAGLPVRRDVDTVADARAVAREFPHTAFARELVSQGHARSADASDREQSVAEAAGA
jgi:hypothetical protein